MPDSLAPERMAALLPEGFGRPYRYAPACPSTQRLLGPELPEGALAVCDEQTAGRGRLGRAWQAPAGTAILCSLLLRPPRDRRAPELSLVAGLATAQTVERATGRAAQVKWPNDVLLDGRKVAGVLAEQTGGVVILGIGLNVNQTRAQLPVESAGSLFAADGVRRERAPLLAELVGAVERGYRGWLADGLEGIREELAARDFLHGRRVVVDGVRGVGLGIDRLGRFELEVDGERRTIESGELSVER